MPCVASNFRTKHGIVLVNIEFDGFQKKGAVLVWVGPRRLNCALVLKGPEGVGWGWVGEAAESWQELGRVGGFGSLGAGEAELEMHPLTLEA